MKRTCIETWSKLNRTCVETWSKVNRTSIEIESDMQRKKVESSKQQLWKTKKGEPTATLFHHEFGRYVTVISRDITSIIQCLRWCKTECAACTPCWNCGIHRVPRCLHTHAPRRGLVLATSKSKPHQQNRKSTVQTETYALKKANPINRTEVNSSNRNLRKQTPSTDQKATV